MTVKARTQTLKATPEDELSFISAVVRKSLDYFESSWDMTVLGGLMLGLASEGNPGKALYMLSVIDPQPNTIVTDGDVVNHFPMGFQGDWDTTWDEFRVQDEDQCAVFRR